MVIKRLEAMNVSRIGLLVGMSCLALAGGSLVAASCAGNADKDSDGYFGETALCGDPIFDCDEDDRSVGNGSLYFCDVDGDGYGDPSRTVYLCDEVECEPPPCPGVTNSLDCNDEDATSTTGIQLFPDCDGDSLGDPSRSLLYCTENNDQSPQQDFNGCAYVLNGDDCDDSDGVVNLSSVVWLDCDGDLYGDEIVGSFRVCPNAFNLNANDPTKTRIETKNCNFATEGGDCVDDEEGVNPASNPETNICPDDEGEEAEQ